jgi:hypothetical protein
MPNTLDQYEQPRQSAQRQPNPILQDGETYFGTFVGFSAPFQTNDFKTGEPIWKVVLIYDLDNVGKYKEFVRISTYDGAAGKDGRRFKCARLFLRLQSLCGVKNSSQAKRVDLDTIKNLRVKVTAAQDEYGNVVLASVKVIQPSVVQQPPQPVGGPTKVSDVVAHTAIPGVKVPEPTLDDVKKAFLASGRSQAMFDMFLVVNGGASQNVRPEAAQRLLRAVYALPPIEPTLENQAKAAGLDLADEEVPF